MAERNTAEVKTETPKASSRRVLLEEVLARRIKNAEENGVIDAKMRRSIERMSQNIRKEEN